MKRGTQVAYIPLHANNNLTHPDVEFGFVIKEQGGIHHFCRFWRKGEPGALRTTANSELVHNCYLIKHRSVDQAIVDAALVELGYTEKEQA